MIRITIDTAQALLALIATVMEDYPTNATRYEAMFETLTDDVPRGDRATRMALYNVGRQFMPVNQLRDIKQALSQSLVTAGERDGADGELINLIALITADVMGRNRLSGETFKALKSALLTPDEMEKLRDQAKVFTCAGCRRVLTDLEQVTFRKRDADVHVMCHNCASPQVIAAGNCSDHVRPVAPVEVPPCETCTGPRKGKSSMHDLNFAMMRDLVGGAGGVTVTNAFQAPPARRRNR